MNVITKTLFTCLAAALACACSGKQTQEKDIIRTIEDLDGKSISVLGGSVQDLLICERCPNGILYRSDAESDTYLMVENGKTCGCVTSSLSWPMARRSYNNITTLADDINPKPIAFGFSKSNGELREKFNAFLKDYLAKNDIEQIITEWSDPDSPRAVPSPDEITGENGTLHFASAAISPPFDFIKNGEMSGIEPEIMAEFAKSLNMKWDFVDVQFTGLIPYVQSGKGDICSCVMCITPERQESIDFSDAWYSESSVLLVNSKYAPAELRESGTVQKASLIEQIKNNFYKTVIKEDRYKMLLEGLWVTVMISLLAALFGTILGILMCYLLMRPGKLVSGATHLVVEFLSWTPVLVFLMIMFYIIFGKSDISGEWVAVIAFSICFGAYTSIIFQSCVKSIDKGQTEAALSMGFSKFRAFTNVVLPQTVQRALPLYKGEFISLIKETSVVGYIAVFDLTKAGDIIRSRTYDAFFSLILVTVIYFLVIWAFTALLKLFETKTKPSRKFFFK